ncbi:MAG: RidA family protein [Bacteroidia bacterium]|nr:RidA family protein [Bacteroidia bacterium]
MLRTFGILFILGKSFGQQFDEKTYTRGMEYVVPPSVSPVGPYSPAVRVGPWIFLSGQIALRPDGSLEKTSIRSETEQVLLNLRTVLEAAGARPENLVKVTIYLTDMAFFSEVNAIYQNFFPYQRFPARETLAVSALPKGARVEISGIAYKE